jgi:tRNA-dihydrouridine synthase
VVTTVAVTLTAGADANPDARGRASPLTVRVYAMKAPGPFEGADFFSLFEKDQATLGAELVQREEVLLRLKPYIERELAGGATKLKHITRHVLGLYQGLPGARAFRPELSERAHLDDAGWDVIASALHKLASPQRAAA